MSRLSYALVFFVSAACSLHAQAQRPGTLPIKEVALEATKPHSDPFNELEVDFIFTAPDGEQCRVPAFWAGGNVWKARYSCTLEGVHRYKTECNDKSDSGLHGKEGAVEIGPLKGTGPYFERGFVRVASDHRHFEFPDGSPFLWLGDTWWMGLTKRLPMEDFRTLSENREQKGFNVVQIVAGLYPDMDAFDSRGEGDAGFPWEKDYSRIRPEYFDAADKKMDALVEHNIMPCVVGAWAYHLPWLGMQKMKKHWRNIVARWGAYPVFWCIAGEGLMPYYLTPKDQRDAQIEMQREGWTAIARYVRKIDPWHHPISIHPTDMARKQVADPAVIDFDMLQTGHSDRASIPNTLRLLRESRAASPIMPTLNSEVCYEGILGTCHDDVVRFMVWSSFLAGTAGHTYGANGIWQVNQKDAPYGKSPHGGNWGETPWDEAMKLPGSGQAGLAKKLMEQFAWHKFEPHPEWASYETTGQQPRWGEWIWYPEGKPAESAPAEKRFFRKVFNTLGPKKGLSKIQRATLRAAADDRLAVFLNGERVGTHDGWDSFGEFDVTRLVKNENNVLAVRAENLNPNVAVNPAGLIVTVELSFEDGRVIDVSSDTSWKAGNREEPGWTKIDFQDSAWQSAIPLAPFGGGPWGKFPDIAASMAPLAGGIAGEVRVIYLPLARKAIVHNVESGVKYSANAFDPVTGKSTQLGVVAADEKGDWISPNPPEGVTDWVLILK